MFRWIFSLFLFLNFKPDVHWTFFPYKHLWAFIYFFISSNRFQGVHWMRQRERELQTSLRYCQVLFRKYDTWYASTQALCESIAMTKFQETLFIVILKTLHQVCKERYIVLSMTWILSLLPESGNNRSWSPSSYLSGSTLTLFGRSLQLCICSSGWSESLSWPNIYICIYIYICHWHAYICTWHIYVQFPKL